MRPELPHSEERTERGVDAGRRLAAPESLHAARAAVLSSVPVQVVTTVSGL
jgi:hypothetical protein